MTTTVAELKKFLDNFPDDTNVEVLGGYAGRAYEGDYYTRIDFEIEQENIKSTDEYMCGYAFEYTPKHKEYPPVLFLGRDD